MSLQVCFQFSFLPSSLFKVCFRKNRRFGSIPISIYLYIILYIYYIYYFLKFFNFFIFFFRGSGGVLSVLGKEIMLYRNVKFSRKFFKVVFIAGLFRLSRCYFLFSNPVTWKKNKTSSTKEDPQQVTVNLIAFPVYIIQVCYPTDKAGKKNNLSKKY